MPVIAGGFVGSSLTYALTWARERRRTLDAYRTPQRQAVSAIVAAVHEYQLHALEQRFAMTEVADQARQGTEITSAAELWAATKATGAALITAETAFQTAALTITDAVCWEAQVDAYAAFEQLKLAAEAAAEPANQVQIFDDVEQHIATALAHSEQLREQIKLLVRAAYGRLMPVDTWLNRRRRRNAQIRISQRHQELIERTRRKGGAE